MIKVLTQTGLMLLGFVSIASGLYNNDFRFCEFGGFLIIILLVWLLFEGREDRDHDLIDERRYSR